MGCMCSNLAAKFAFFPPCPPTYKIHKRENDGKLSVEASASTSTSFPLPHADDNSLDVLLIDNKRGSKIVAFYLRNPYARLTLLYSHGNAADLGQLYDLFVQLKVALRVNLIGSVIFSRTFSNFTSLGHKMCGFWVLGSLYLSVSRLRGPWSLQILHL